MSKNNEFVYSQYKKVKVTTDFKNGFVTTKEKDKVGETIVAYSQQYKNETKKVNCPGNTISITNIPVFRKKLCSLKHNDSNGKPIVTLTSYEDGNYLVKAHWRGQSTSFYQGDLFYSYKTENNECSKNGFYISQDSKRNIFISKFTANLRSSGGICIDEYGKVSFTKYESFETELELIEENKPTDIILFPKGINFTTIIRKSAEWKYDESLIALPATITNGKALGVMLTNNASNAELNMTSLSNEFPREGLTYLPHENGSFTMGYAKKDKYGRISFSGARMHKTFDDEYECSLGNNCHEFIASPNFCEFNINFLNNDKGYSGLSFSITELNYIHIYYSDNSKLKLVAKIFFDDLSIEYNGKKYKNPYYVKNDPIEDEFLEQEENEITIEKEEVQSIIDEYMDKKDDDVIEEKIETPKEEPVKKVKPPKVKKEWSWDWLINPFKKLGDSIIRLLGIVLTPFFWIKDKISDLFGSRKARRKYRRRSYYYRSDDNIFLRILKAIGKFFVAMLSVGLTALLFIPKMLGKGLKAIFGGLAAGVGGISAGISGAIMTFTTILTIIMFIIGVTGAAPHIDNFFSDLVSEKIIGLLGLHLCKLFLDAVGVNFFSCIAVAFIFLIDLVTCVLILLLELITLIIYLLFFFICIAGLGGVVLVAFIVALVFAIRDGDSKGYLLITLLINIGFLIPFYIIIVPQLSGH